MTTHASIQLGGTHFATTGGGMVDLVYGADRPSVRVREHWNGPTVEVGPEEAIDERVPSEHLHQLRLYDPQGRLRAMAAPVLLPGVNLVVECLGWPHPFAVYCFQQPYPTRRRWNEHWGPLRQKVQRFLWVPLPRGNWRVTHISKDRLWTLEEVFAKMAARQPERAVC